MKVYPDDRGLFVIGEGQTYDQMFVSSNDAMYVFRGMHYQTEPYQTKVVKVIQGEIIDFLYNLKTGEVEEYKLDSSSKPLYISEDYAHGYMTLRLNTILFYGVTGEFNKDTYKSIPYTTIPAIKERIGEICAESLVIINDKDRNGK